MKNLIHAFFQFLGFRLVRIRARNKSFLVDPIEIQYVDQTFKSFVESSENKEGFTLISLRDYLSPNRIAFFIQLIQKCKVLSIDLDQKSIADFGTGFAYLFRVIQQQYSPLKLTGIDTFEAMMPLAKRMSPDASFRVQSLLDVQEQFDIIFCTEVVEHMVDPKTAVKHMLSCLLPNGMLILSVPDGRQDRTEAGKKREDGSSYWGHINFWSPESWHLFLHDCIPHAEIRTGTVDDKTLYGVIKIAEAPKDA